MKRPGAAPRALPKHCGERLDGARGLDDLDPGLDTALQGCENILAGGGEQTGELGQLGDIGFHGRLCLAHVIPFPDQLLTSVGSLPAACCVATCGIWLWLWV